MYLLRLLLSVLVIIFPVIGMSNPYDGLSEEVFVQKCVQKQFDQGTNHTLKLFGAQYEEECLSLWRVYTSAEIVNLKPVGVYNEDLEDKYDFSILYSLLDKNKNLKALELYLHPSIAKGNYVFLKRPELLRVHYFHSSVIPINLSQTSLIKSISVKLIIPRIKDKTELVDFFKHNFKATYFQKVSFDYCGDIELNGVNEFHNLEQLEILACSDRDDISLPRSSSLKHLKIKYADNPRNRRGKKRSLKLGKMPQLRTLVLHENLLTDIPSLSQYTKLQYLSLSKNFLTHLKFLEDLTIHTLDVSMNLLKSNSLGELFSETAFFANPFLRHLNLSHSGLEGIKGIRKFRNLQTLMIKSEKIKDYSEIQYLPFLHSLTLEYLRNNDLSFLVNKPWLKYLKINNSSINKLSTIANLPQLVSLDIYGTQFLLFDSLPPGLKYLRSALSNKAINLASNLQKLEEVDFVLLDQFFTGVSGELPFSPVSCPSKRYNDPLKKFCIRCDQRDFLTDSDTNQLCLRSFGKSSVHEDSLFDLETFFTITPFKQALPESETVFDLQNRINGWEWDGLRWVPTNINSEYYDIYDYDRFRSQLNH